MTMEERALLEKDHPDLTWTDHKEPGFTRLVGNPACPLLGYDKDGRALCTVHDIRPYNCRRWGCLRAGLEQRYDVKAVRHRIDTDKWSRQQAKRLQKEAMPWALEHGWTP